MNENLKRWLIVAAVAFGYFVDLYDLLLFGAIRSPSLKELGLEGENAIDESSWLMNITVIGMLVGGFTWGIVADRKGRITVLFASVLTYSLANIANAFVQDIFSYEVCRFISGFGLAGEFGVGLTLVSEILPEKHRTYAGIVVSAFGLMGAVVAGVLAYIFSGQTILNMSSWRFLFIVGGGLGLLALIFRKYATESEVFEQSKFKRTTPSYFLLFASFKRMRRFAYCFLVGAPIFVIIGILIIYAPEFALAQGVRGVSASVAIIWCYSSIAVGDIVGTFASKFFKTRRGVLFAFLLVQITAILTYYYFPVTTATSFYLKTSFLGLSIGSWGTLALNSVEQFGTDFRATVASAVPNLVRVWLVPMSVIYVGLKPSMGMNMASLIPFAISFSLAFLALWRLKDNFEKNLNYAEETR